VRSPESSTWSERSGRPLSDWTDREKRAADAQDRAATDRQLDKALEAYERAIRLDPRYAEPYRAIGIIRYKAGERDEALKAFRRYLEAEADAPDAQQVRDYILEVEPR